LSLEQINPFYFPEPLAPLVASQKYNHRITLNQVLGHIQKVRQKISRKARDGVLLIEGAGGLLVPLGKGYTWVEVIQKLGCDLLVVAANRLGTINHTLLTVRTLQTIRHQQLAVALSSLTDPLKATADMRSNARIVTDFLPSIPLFQIPFLGTNPCHFAALKKNGRKLKKTLARILACYKLSSVASRNQTDNKKKNKSLTVGAVPIDWTANLTEV